MYIVFPRIHCNGQVRERETIVLRVCAMTLAALIALIVLLVTTW